MERPLVLVGFMGCGKSSVARALASLLDCSATDTDALVELVAGMPVADIFATSGEAAFRRIETEQLEQALQAGGILATGGGILTREENRTLLKQAAEEGGLVVYLRAGAEELAQRIRKQPGKRPLIDGDEVLDLHATQARVEALLQQRAPWYTEVANLVVDTGAPGPDSVARRIVRMAGLRKPTVRP